MRRRAKWLAAFSVRRNHARNSALTFAVCFRWTALTGGESGLGGIVRPAIGPVNLDDPVVFLVLVALAMLGIGAVVK